MSGSTGEAEPRFEVEDAVVLKSNRTLVGIVEKTYNDPATDEPLEDLLIIAQVTVPTTVLQHFVHSERPPRGYLFVRFSDERIGYSLVPEDSVILLNRSFTIGDTVKQNSGNTRIGTVVNVENTYTLEPICRFSEPPFQPQFGPPHGLIFTSNSQSEEPVLITEPDDRLSQVLSHPAPTSLIYNVPEEEIKRADDFVCGDRVLYHDWLGVVEDHDIDVAILFADGAVVWVDKPWELELVVPHLDKPLVALPEFDNIARPDVLNANYNGMTSIPSKRVSRGQFVITNKKNLRDGRWLEGAHDPNRLAQGRVLDVRSRSIDVQWLAPNAFARAEFAPEPSDKLKPYENLSFFRDPRDLRRSKDIALYDHSKRPSGEQGHKAAFSSGSAHQPGDQVRFRDPGGAILKYSSTATTVGISLNLRVPRHVSHGFDMNEYRIIICQQYATVLWPDGSTSKVISTSINTFVLPEADLCPGDLVTAKAGMQMYSDADTSMSEFNEMSFFEGKYDLIPMQVGVVQSVDAKERLARVRWFEKPDIGLCNMAHVLNPARFGKIGEAFEDVSLYEIMTHPVLMRKRRDMVVVAPLHAPQKLAPRDTSLSSEIPLHGSTTLTYLRMVTDSIHTYLRDIAMDYTKETLGSYYTEDISYSSPPTYDWIGEIINVGLDGMLTVRFGGMKNCPDIQISHDDIMLLIDEEAENAEPLGLHEDHDDTDFEYLSDGAFDYAAGGYSYVSYEGSPIDEVVEYEGGSRLDEGSGNEEWMTDEETGGSSDPSLSKDEDIEMTENIPSISPMMGVNAVPKTTQNAVTSLSTALGQSTKKRTTSPLISFAGTTPPERFAILESPPAEDQFRHKESPNIAPSLLKRIYREHRILTSSLPEGEIYVRTYESRLDLLRCLIIGPADTPYEHAPFLVDLHLGPKFPKEPPTAHFHSWTSGLGRINPNLYEEGKICLSLLGTWPGQAENEGWSEKATILQLLVSLQGLVMVQQPFYNEAGFERYGEEKIFTLESQQYSEKAYIMARGFLKSALISPVVGLEDVLSWLYISHVKISGGGQPSPGLLAKLIERSKGVIARSQALKEAATSREASGNMVANGEGSGITEISDLLIDGSGQSEDSTKTFLKPLSQGALVMLGKTIKILEEIHQGFVTEASAIA